MDERDLPPEHSQDKKDESSGKGESPEIDTAAATEWQGPSSVAADGGVSVPRTIGPYRLLKKLGEGGMGQVWLAQQEAPLRRQVALKLIRVGLYDDSVIQRFQSERQSLAIMNHPAIARVYDAGATPDGQPYFVMEYVDGVAVTEYCDSRQLKIAERLDLFIKICEGVQHAHQKAIIHRDLKPANILVVEVDGKPTPRIIDFGLAKAVSAGAGAASMLTQGVGFVGTPGFMSPEQAAGAGLDIDTRTDVYSLGVVLYVLLTGTLPFNREKWQKRPLYEAMREIYEEEPERPSAKIESDKQLSEISATRRGIEAPQLSRLLRGDLDWIAMKALEKDRERRYGTPTELAADLRRYLRHEPVIARPASPTYRLRKYVRRHRVGVSVAAGLALLLMGFAGVQAEQVRRITRERDRANRITVFMTDMFKVSDPSEARGNTVTAREILDKASGNIDHGLAKDPQVQAQMMYVMGTVYTGLGLYSQSESLLNRAVNIQKKALGSENPETLQSINALGEALLDSGKTSEAERVLQQGLEVARRRFGTKDRRTLAAMNDLALVMTEEGRTIEAEKLLQEVNQTSRIALPPGDSDALRYEGNLASVLTEMGRMEEAERLQREIVEACTKTFGPDHPTTLNAITNLAVSVSEQGRYAESEGLYRQLIEKERRVLGPEHPYTLRAMSNMAGTISDQGRYAEAERLQRDLYDIQRRVLGAQHPDTLSNMGNLVNTLSGEKRYAEAEELQLEVLDIDRRVLGPNHPDTATAIYDLACVKALAGRREEALALVRQSLEHGLDARTAASIGEDDDLASLRGDPRFAAIVAEGRERAALAQKSN